MCVYICRIQIIYNIKIIHTVNDFIIEICNIIYLCLS